MSRPAGESNAQDAQYVKHTRIGVWDLYEDSQADKPQASSRWETYAKIRQSMPLVARMLKDILSIRRARMRLSALLVVEVLDSLIPAISLWYVTKL